MWRLVARVAAMIRIDSLWLAVAPMDMRVSTERLLARVVQVFGSAQAHHGYLFSNTRGTRIKLLVHDGLAYGVQRADSIRGVLHGRVLTLTARLQ